MTDSLHLAVTWEPMIVLVLPLAIVFAVLVLRVQRPAGAGLMMALGFVAGILGVVASSDRPDHAAAVPLAILGAGLLVAGAVLRTGARDRTPPA